MISRVFTQYFDSILSASAIFAGVLIIYLSTAFGIHQYGIGSILILAGLIYLFLRKKLTAAHEAVSWDIDGRIKILNNIIFVIVLISSIWLLQSNLYVRPLSYFLLTCVAILSVCFEIFYSKKNSDVWLILFKIILIGITIRAGLYYEFPSIYGIDPWFHQYLIQDYIDVGHIPPSIGNQYQILPIFHLLVANLQLITATATRTAYFLSVGLIEVVAVIFVFLIGQSIFNKTTGLLASVFIVISDYWILWGVWIIPQTLGLVFFLIILYIVLVLNRKKQNIGSFLFIIFSIVLILTHTIAAFITLIALLSIYFVANVLYKNHRYVSLVALLLFLVMMLTHWTGYAFQAQYSFLTAVLLGMGKALMIGTEFANPELVSVQLAPAFGHYLNQLGHLSLLGLGMFGAFIFASARKRNVGSMCLIITMILLYVITYAFPLFGLRNILTTRWFAFIYVPLALMGAIALIYITNLAKSQKSGILILTILILFVSFFMITNTKVDPDNPIYAKEYAKITASKDSEMAAAASIAGLFGRQSMEEDRPYLTTDSGYGILYNYMYTEKIGAADLSLEPPKYPIVVLREYAFTGSISMAVSERTGLRIPYTLDEEYEARFKNKEYNKVYDNQQVWAYIKRSG